MSRRPRRPASKLKVPLAAGKGDRTLAQLAEQFLIRLPRGRRSLRAVASSQRSASARQGIWLRSPSPLSQRLVPSSI